MAQLSFVTENQEFFIALQNTPRTPVSPGSLEVNTDYYVSVQVKNPTIVPITGTFNLTGGVFVIGNPPNQHSIPVPPQVIPGATGTDPWGEAWVQFPYHTGPSGHGCLFVSIVKENGLALASPPVIQQNTDTIGTPIGQPAMHSFQVYLPPPKNTVYLNVIETPQQGSTPETWSPKMILTSNTPGHIDTTPPAMAGIHGYVGGAGTQPGGTYTVQLEVTPAALAAGSHDFTVYGAFIDQLITDPTNPNFAGLVTVTVTVTPSATPKSKLWLCGDGNLGGPNHWDSPDIVLYDMLGTPVNNYHDLQPSTAYGFHVCIHNAGAEAQGVTVQFLRAPGGVFNGANPLSSVMSDIPANNVIEVILPPPVDFVSAPANAHCCAWVKIYANNNETGSELCVYRNTNSGVMKIGASFRIPLALGMPVWKHPGPGPVEIDVEVKTHMLPAGWEKNPKIVSELKAAREKGIKNVEILQTPTFLELLKKTSIPIEVKAGALKGVKAAGIAFKKNEKRQSWQIQLPPKLEQVPFVVEGTISKDAKPGETDLVVVTVKYPKIGRFPAQSVQFRQLYHVVEK